MKCCYYIDMLLLQYGLTALQWACINGHVEVVKLLISNNADVAVTTNVSERVLFKVTGYLLNFLRVLILLATKPAFLCFVLNGLVTTFKTLNKEYINTVDRPLSSTVIWHDSIDYGFITLEPKSRQSLQHYQFWLYPSKDRKIWHYKTSSFSKICTFPPRCRTKERKF